MLLKNIAAALLLSVGALTSFNAGAEDTWKHRHLSSQDGKQIALDFQHASNCLYFENEGRSDNEVRLADPVWINVHGLNPNDQVEVDVEFWMRSYRQTGSAPQPLVRSHQHYDRSLALSYAGEGRFTANLGSLAIRHNISSAYTSWNIGQKLRIKVNGQSLINPVDGTDQFLIFLDDSKACGNFR